MDQLWLSAIGEYGFPIVITFYLLYRIEKRLDRLNQSVLLLQTVCPINHNKYSFDNNPKTVGEAGTQSFIRNVEAP